MGGPGFGVSGGWRRGGKETNHVKECDERFNAIAIALGTKSCYFTV